MMALYSIINFRREFKLEANYFEGKGQGVNYFEKGGGGGGGQEANHFDG